MIIIIIIITIIFGRLLIQLNYFVVKITMLYTEFGKRSKEGDNSRMFMTKKLTAPCYMQTMK